MMKRSMKNYHRSLGMMLIFFFLGHYGYPAQGLIHTNTVHFNKPQSRLENFNVEILPEDGPNLQVPQPIHFVQEETEFGEKTICFTPSMVHKMIKAALEYVSSMPSDINNIVEKLDQELNRMSDTETEENAVKPMYPLDSKTIFQMLDKPRSEARTNLILKYELPSMKEPKCREALEKLIEIAYTAYLELEQHPQCREYLHNFAAQQPEERPTDQLEQGPDIKSFIASILDEVDKRKPKQDISPPGDRYGDMPVINNPTQPKMNAPPQDYNMPKQPQFINHNGQPKNIPKYVPEQPEFNVPQVQKPIINEYNVPQAPELHKPEFNIPQIQEYNINEYNVPKVHEKIINEYNVPNAHELNKPQFNIPNVHEYNINEYNLPKVHETIINEYNVPNAHELMKPEFNIPNVHEYTITQSHEYNLPTVKQHKEFIMPQINELFSQSHEYNMPLIKELITQSQEYTMPQINEFITQSQEFTMPQINKFITQSHEYHVPKVQYSVTNEYNIPQTQEIQSIEMPEVHETVHETITEIIPMQPEETINILIQLVKSDQYDPGNLFDRLLKIIQENQNNFHPRIHNLLITLLNVHKQKNIPKFNDIFLLLLDAQRNRDWPWNERVTEQLLSYLMPNQNGYLDSRIIEIIVNLYKTQPNEKVVEYILSLLRPIKEGKVNGKIADIILRLIILNQRNLLRPDHLEILIKLLQPSQNGNINPVDVDVADNLSRWNEMGMSPQQFNAINEILKPYALYGLQDHRPVDIIHFLLTKGGLLNPKHIEFILSFLYPNHGVLVGARIDVIYFILNNLSRYPQSLNTLLKLLIEHESAVLNSRFLEILLFLNSNGLLTPEIVETIITLLTLEVNGKLEDHHVKTLFYQLTPFKQSHPNIIVDVLSLLTQGGLHGNLIKWLETTNNMGLPNRDTTPTHNVKPENGPQDNTNEYRTPDGGYQTEEPQQQVPVTPDRDFMAILKWLDSQGLLTKDLESNKELVNKILNILQVGQRELGVVELTYMLKHEKPLIYQPVYYVKYRLPILSFISNMKTLLLENPNLNADPMKLLQELIVSSNVTEVSPNLQGYPKEEILKLTFNDGDLVQAKILDEQNLSLNDQITYVHGLNSDISPEEILQLNQINEAKYFPKFLEIKGVQPTQLTIKEVKEIIDVPPVHYRHLELPDVKPGQAVHYRQIELPAAVAHQTHRKTKTVHHSRQTYITRDNSKQATSILLNNNAQL